MGLLDIWNDWRKETGSFKDAGSNLQTMAQDSNTIDRNKINRKLVFLRTDKWNNRIWGSGVPRSNGGD